MVGTSVIIGEDIFLDLKVVVRDGLQRVQKSRMFMVEVLGMPRCGGAECRIEAVRPTWKAVRGSPRLRKIV